MKNLLKSITLILLLGLTITAFGQHRGHRGPHDMQLIEKFKTDLNLTPAQETQLAELQAKGKAAMKNLKEGEYEEAADRKEAMHELMKEQKSAVEKILTEEQKAILQKKKEALRNAHKEQFEKIDHKALKEEMHQYREKNMMPTLRAQRAKLESKISAEDKTTIAELRTKFKAIDAKHKELKKERGPHPKGHFKGMKEEQKPERETLKTLVDKYKDNIETLMEEIAPQQEQWKKEMKAIAEKYMPKEEGADHRKRKGKHNKHFDRKIKQSHFLLLDPNAESLGQSSTQGNNQAWTKIRTYPNPTVNSNKLDYTVVKAGQLRIELHNESGNLVKVLLNENRTPGDYSLVVDFSSLRSGSYYLIVKDQGGVSSQKVVVTK
ncbi:MAG: hypothetical protein DHS20C18_07050 [Saprospiraceae bacterium]|nr:MAG: hypothetical protein DHS20C18_07050 [Saprospiraceae bacterium]